MDSNFILINEKQSYFNPIKSLKLSNNTLPTHVVNKTINKTQPCKTFAFGVSIYAAKANAIAPLIKPEYHTIYNSLIFKGNFLLKMCAIQGAKNIVKNRANARTPIIIKENIQGTDEKGISNVVIPRYANTNASAK